MDKNPLLMMEMLMHGNLDDFMKSRKKSISLSGKLLLMFSITMGLRFLEKFKIVHLDFKPSNIMMIPGMLIKIIDFGEAYHSEVVKKEGPIY
jgi:serine/threonine protein kinase